MIFEETNLEGLYLITPELKCDSRGFFSRIFCQKEFEKIGLQFNIVQASLSLTRRKGTIRGMHFQKEPFAEGKIVQCLKGSIYDVVIDLRPASATFGKWTSAVLNDKNKKMLYIPKGFAHGFQTLISNSEVQYFMSEIYHSNNVSGVRWNDPLLNIKWPIKNPILSDNDKSWPLLRLKKNDEKSKE